jgi:hypothetical protein
MIEIKQIVNYLSENIIDPMQKYIFQKEIQKTPTTSTNILNAVYSSKYYIQLADEQWENGSWGRFHSMGSEGKKQKFATTEAALKRARELGLSKDDPLIAKCMKLMERYVGEDETWTDKIEKHHDNGKSHMISRTYLTAANINLFSPDNPVIKQKRDVCVRQLQEAFASGYFDKDIWDKENREYRGTCLTAYSVYPLWLVQNTDCMSETLQRNYLNYIWNRQEGIYYVSDFPPNRKSVIEDKRFSVWLSTLENLSGFSLFPEFMKDEVIPHLLNEIYRLMNTDVIIPDTYNVRFAENWRSKKNRQIDIVLRIARIIAKTSNKSKTDTNTKLH